MADIVDNTQNKTYASAVNNSTSIQDKTPEPQKVFKATTSLSENHPSPKEITKTILNKFSSLVMLTINNNTLSVALSSHDQYKKLFNTTFVCNDYTFHFSPPLASIRVKLLGLPFGVTKEMVSFSLRKEIGSHFVVLDTYEETNVLNGNATAWLRVPENKVKKNITIMGKTVKIKAFINTVKDDSSISAPEDPTTLPATTPTPSAISTSIPTSTSTSTPTPTPPSTSTPPPTPTPILPPTPTSTSTSNLTSEGFTLVSNRRDRSPSPSRQKRQISLSPQSIISENKYSKLNTVNDPSDLNKSSDDDSSPSTIL